MDIIRFQQDENNIWHVKLGGIDNGVYKLIDLTIEGESIESWLEENDALVLQLLASGIVNEEFNDKLNTQELKDEINNEIDYIEDTLLTIDTMTNTQVRAVVKRLLLEQRAELKAWKYIVGRIDV